MDKLTAAPRVGGARTSVGGGAGRAGTTAVGEYKGAPTATSFAAFAEEGAGLKLCVPGGSSLAACLPSWRARARTPPFCFISLSLSLPFSLSPAVAPRRSPATVLSASLGFIVSVIILHIIGRFTS